MMMHEVRFPASFGYLTAVLGLTLLMGCGPSRPETVPVRGKVTLDGGEWPAPGMIIFTAVRPAEGFPRHPGKALFDKAGNFTVGSFAKDDGLMPGIYYVTVLCGEPVENMQSEGKSYVPDRYMRPGQSGLELRVEPGSGAIDDLRYDIPRE
jgi:hypothetical protein